MPRFEYDAINAEGQKLTGMAEGADAREVIHDLRLAGWTVTSLQPADLAAITVTDAIEEGEQETLSVLEATLVAQQLIAATEASLPLTAALRAFAEEGASKRLKRRLVPVCEQLESGQSVEQVLRNPKLRIPEFIGGILNSGLPPSAMSDLLVHTLQAGMTFRELKRRFLLLLSYPLCMLLAVAGLWIFLLVYVTPIYGSLIDSFGLQKIPSLAYLVRISESLRHWYWWFGGLVAFVIGICVAVRFSSPVVRSRIWSYLPLVGAMYRFTALSELAYRLAVILESRIPLPRALNWSAQGLEDAELTSLVDDVARRIEGGDSVPTITAVMEGLPSYLEEILRWSEQGSQGVAPLKGLSRMLQLRAQFLAESTLPLLEPLMVCGAVTVAVFYLTIVVPSLLRMLHMLS